MTWRNYDDVLSQLQAEGLDVSDGLTADTTRPMRVREANGDREKRGWYWLHTLAIDSDQYLVGSFGIYRGNDAGTLKVKLNRDGKSLKIDAAERAAIAARQKADRERMQALRAAEARKAAAKASHVWRHYQAQPADGKDSTYLKRKNVRAHGLRFAHGAQTIAVPMMDAAGGIHGLQLIRGSDRRTGQLEKEYFPRGLAKTGHFHLIGGAAGKMGQVILVAEGYATAATLHQATGYPVAVAFDANNLQPVALALRDAYKTSRPRFLICADDDYLTGNPGEKAAHLAAMAVDGSVVLPKFATDRAGQKITDFNDLAEREGEATVRAQIEAHLLALGWHVPEVTVAAFPTPGSGGASAGGAGDGASYSDELAHSVMPLDDLIERFIPIDDGRGKCVFDRVRNDIVDREQMLALLPAGMSLADIKRHYRWQSRGAYFDYQIGFDPAGNDPAVKLNKWLGWPMQPSDKGSCEKLLDLFYYQCTLEGNAAEIYNWGLDWMAYPLQNPGAKMASAIIMHGPQGTGKNTIFETLARIYGKGDPRRNYSVYLDQKALQDNTNADWENKLFVLADEVVNGSDKWQLKNELKAIVTSETIRIRKLYFDGAPARNRCNMVFLSNEHQPLPLDNDDRRHLVIRTPPPIGRDKFNAIYAEIEAGGVAAFYHFLMQRDLTGFHPKHQPPMTLAKAALIAISAPSEQRFILEWMAGDLGLPVCPVLSTDLYAAYLRWCRQRGESRPRADNQFHGAVAHMPGWSKAKARVHDNYHLTGPAQPRMIVFPPDTAMKTADDDRSYIDGTSRTEWITTSVLDFAAALHAGEEKRSAFA